VVEKRPYMVLDQAFYIQPLTNPNRDPIKIIKDHNKIAFCHFWPLIVSAIIGCYPNPLGRCFYDWIKIVSLACFNGFPFPSTAFSVLLSLPRQSDLLG